MLRFSENSSHRVVRGRAHLGITDEQNTHAASGESRRQTQMNVYTVLTTRKLRDQRARLPRHVR